MTVGAAPLRFPSDRLGRAREVIFDIVSGPSGAIGLALVVFHVVLAFVSPYIAAHDYKAVSSRLMLKGPSPEPRAPSTGWARTISVGTC